MLQMDKAIRYAHQRTNSNDNCDGDQIWDIREMKKKHSADYCHDMPLRNIDTAANYIATCADDCVVKIWDNRSSGITRPIVSLL